MRLTDVLAALRDQLASSAELQAFCVEQFGRNPKIMAGFNARRPPQDEDLPAVVLVPDRSDINQGGGAEHHIGLIWAIRDASVEDDGDVVTYSGFFRADEMGELIRSALDAVSDEYRITWTGYDLGSSEQSPAFSGEMELVVAEW